VPRPAQNGVARLSFFSSLLHSKREKRHADRWQSARTTAPRRHARRQNDLQLDAQHPYPLRKPNVAPQFSSTRAPMPLQNVGGFRVSPEILPGRQWAFSHRYFRRKKSMYRYSKTTLSSQILGTLDFTLLVCCEGVFPGFSGYFPVFSSISQYFPVFPSISQLFPVFASISHRSEGYLRGFPGISQYFPAFPSISQYLPPV